MEKTNTLVTSTLTIGLVALIVGLGIGYAIGSNRIGVPGMGSHMMSNGAMMRDGTMGSADQHFIVQMIPHHEGAIEMAEVALERSKRPEIRSLAEDIIAAQTAEINDMRAWYEAWYGEAPPQGGMPGMHMGGMTGDTALLATISGDAFDREFMEQMIPHHEMAIMMAQMIRNSERAEMRELAENIISSQAREIGMMRGWLASWYSNN